MTESLWDELERINRERTRLEESIRTISVEIRQRAAKKRTASYRRLGTDARSWLERSASQMRKDLIS